MKYPAFLPSPSPPPPPSPTSPTFPTSLPPALHDPPSNACQLVILDGSFLGGKDWIHKETSLTDADNPAFNVYSSNAAAHKVRKGAGRQAGFSGAGVLEGVEGRWGSWSGLGMGGDGGSIGVGAAAAAGGAEAQQWVGGEGGLPNGRSAAVRHSGGSASRCAPAPPSPPSSSSLQHPSPLHHPLLYPLLPPSTNPCSTPLLHLLPPSTRLMFRKMVYRLPLP